MNLVKILKGLLIAAPKSDIRYYLNGIQVIRHKDRITLNATDGHLLLQVEIKDMEQFDIQEDVKFIISRESLNVMIKSFTVKCKPVLRCDDDFNVTLGDLPLTLIDGNYPDVQRVIYKSKERPCDEIGLNLNLLSRLSKACATIIDGKYPRGKMMVRGVTDSVMFTNTYDSYKFTSLIMPCRL